MSDQTLEPNNTDAAVEAAAPAPDVSNANVTDSPADETNPHGWTATEIEDHALFDAMFSSADAGRGLSPGEIDYGSTFRSLKEGEVIRGKIVHIDREGVLVDVGTKSEGLVTPQELSRGVPGAPDVVLNVGDPIDVFVIEAEDQEGNPVLSKKRADFEKAWERVLEARDEGETITAMVTDRVKGGLVVDLGIRGFIPASHVGSGRVRNLEQYIAQVLPLKVIEVDKERRKVVLSHRLATEEERERQRVETVNSLGEGQERPGVVRRITDYGAFVDLGGIDGLLHISEMSWTRIKHPSEVVKVGDEIQVMVLKVNLEQNRVSLGLRQIIPDPWIEIASRFNPNDVVQGTVSRLVPFGAFVALEGGVEGIIPNNELSSKRVNKPEQVVKVGEEVEVKVLEVQKEERRIVLSRRQVESQKEQETFRDFSRERQQQPAREQQRFTIGDALAGQLSDLGRGGEAQTPEPEAVEQDLAETAETLAASPVGEPQTFGETTGVIQGGGAAGDDPVETPAGSEQSVSPQGMGDGCDQVVAEDDAEAEAPPSPSVEGVENA